MAWMVWHLLSFARVDRLMKMNTSMGRTALWLAALMFSRAGWLQQDARAATFVVTSAGDSGAGSLRQAVLNANTGGATNLIAFAIPGSAPFRIGLQSALPALSNAVTIDATTQPGFAGAPVVELDGTTAGTNANGLWLTAGNSTVRGLVISHFHGHGIRLEGTGGNVIQGNFIGTDLAGTSGAGNGLDGVRVVVGSGNVIGGNGFGAGNTIAFNGGAGVAILAGTNNLVRANSIFQNGGLGLELGPAGVTANDSGDVDTGANQLQNFPVLTGVDATGSNVMISGTLSSAPTTSFQVDFYYSPAASPSGYGEGRTYLGWGSVTTDAGGNGTFWISFPGGIPANSYVTATATDPSGNTSEFSSWHQFMPANPVNLSVTASASPNPVPLGKQVAYSITVTNSGTNAASGVALANPLPATMAYLYAYASQGAVTGVGSNVTCNFGTLVPGGTATLTIYASPQSVGGFTSTATLSQNEFNLNATNQVNQLLVNVYSPAALALTTQPASQTLNLGGLLNLVVGVIASPSVRYQWRLNGANIPGATNATYAVSSLLAGNAGSYTVVVSDETGAITSLPALVTLSGLLGLPASDNFATRGIMVNLLGLTSYNNIGATSEPGEPMHAGVPGGKSVWFTWTPLLSGVATFSTAGSSFDTLLAVYTGNSLTNLTEVASDDDSGGYYTSKVVFNAVAGTTYSIAVDGAYGASGNIILNSSFELLGPTVPRITTQPVTQVTDFGSTATFSVGVYGSGMAYQWYRNDVPIAGANGPSLQVTNVSAANVGLYTAVVSAGSRTTRTRPANLEISTTDGSVNTTRLALDKFQAAGGAAASVFQLQKFTLIGSVLQKFSSGPQYDSAGGGTSHGYSSTQVFSTYAGQAQQGEPNHCGTAGGASSWTYIQAADNGVMTLDTDGSGFNTILAVYTGDGNDFSTLVPVACDVGSGTGGTNSLVSFAASSNTVYYIAVDGQYGAYGTVVLNANLGIPPVISAQPVDQTAAPGTSVTLYAAATGSPNPNCQWWNNGAVISGATNYSLTITNFQPSKQGNYQMTAVNNMGGAASSPAAVLVNSVLHLDSFGQNAAGRLFQMRVVGVANTNYIIQASSDLSTWIPVATNASPTGLWQFTDLQATNFPSRYYRAVPK